ncbi:uncharacterized protein LOC121975149 [Zingiber officinale]|uniref:Uncharacterized protein n=1 Tax=Zingiber officinale TaxID=94328 RepID=A0A8J5L3P2_ZINOF|nr:uncharacterized protein LOC121975149 [Zingiber officinale]KAG6510595.1 hypothetical protein ZIOFF_028620 [Zingiber officinale]KAG6514287.1 hypothetical protein ZIOFF_024637 [Zingiber officinale]
MATDDNMEQPVTPYGRVEGVASWVGASVVSAFFASLERCSCITLNTFEDEDDDDDDEQEEVKDRPLMLTKPPNQYDDVDESQSPSPPV